MSELSRETEELLNRGRSGTPLSRAHRDELKGAVLAKLATGAAVTTSTSAAAWTVTTKVIGMAAIAAVIGGATVGVVHHRSHAQAPTAMTASINTNSAAPLSTAASVPSPVTPAATSPSVVAVPEAPAAMPNVSPIAATPVAPTSIANAPAGTTQNVARSTGRNADDPTAAHTVPTVNMLAGDPLTSTATSSPASGGNTRAGSAAHARPSSLEEETALLRAALDALDAGDPTRALALLDQHANRFPTSALEPERSAERVFALCAAHRHDEAHVAANGFLSAHSSGPLASRVRASCGGS